MTGLPEVALIALPPETQNQRDECPKCHLQYTLRNFLAEDGANVRNAVTLLCGAGVGKFILLISSYHNFEPFYFYFYMHIFS
jgi:hypothetical protein